MGTRPLPDLSDPDFGPYFQACAGGKLRIPHCAGCGWWQWPPRAICPRCQNDAWTWDQAGGTATLYSWTTIWRPGLPGFDDQVPFAIVVVELDAVPSVRMLSNAVDCRPADLAIGLRMEVVFREIAAQVTLPYWRPAKSSAH